MTSIARGTNVIPKFAQLLSWRHYFRSSATSSAYLAFVAALMRELDCSVEATVTSNAAGFAAFHVGTKMSRGRDWLSGTRLFCSATGERFADEQAEIRAKFRIRAEYRLGVPVYDAKRKCPFCKAGVLEIYGDHAIACHGRRDAIAKHDRMQLQNMTGFEILSRIRSCFAIASLRP